jgi:uncharacterized protein involved in type VI secretion and phage assembly
LLGIGAQWTPRIGHEVLVGHVDDYLEQPIILGGLPRPRRGRRARHAGGPRGRGRHQQGLEGFCQQQRRQPLGPGNLSGGHGPAWHGGAPGEFNQGGQRNAAALSD